MVRQVGLIAQAVGRQLAVPREKTLVPNPTQVGAERG